MQKLHRRDVLRGTGMAALAAGVAVVPFAAKASGDANLHVPAGTDAKVLELGQRCLAQAREALKHCQAFRRAAEQQAAAFAQSGAQRWLLRNYMRLSQCPETGKWSAHGANHAPSWYAHEAGEDRPKELETRWFPLKARTENAARKEAIALDRKLDKEFWEAQRKAGIPFNRDRHYNDWCSSTDELRRMGRRLAKLRAKTFEGVALKATVLAITREAMDDDDICCEDLQASILLDVTGNARAVA